MSTVYMSPTTLSSLKEYVSGSSTMQQSAESTVLLYVTHCHLKAQFPEIRLDKHVSRACMGSCCQWCWAFECSRGLHAVCLVLCDTRTPLVGTRALSFPQMSVDAVKTRINSMTGTSLHTMVLHLKDSSGRLVGVLEDDTKKLGYYGPENG